MSIRILSSVSAVSLGLLVGLLHAATIEVPADYSTIQEAVDAATQGDTVLVAEGHYFENVHLRDREIVLASSFLLDGEPSHILNTIIDGSQPSDPDSGSVLLIAGGQTRATEIVGFTLTGGDGTPNQDDITSTWWTEGGGILIEESSPTIRGNLITGNDVRIAKANTGSAGGGGIRAGYGSPLIEQNAIVDNGGLYGAGLVLNATDAELRNNLIGYNFGATASGLLGGGGLWIWGAANSNRLDNNTIVGNESPAGPGAILNWNGALVGQGNIIWANDGSWPDPIRDFQASAETNFTYSLIQGGLDGTGNLDLEPLFAGSQFTLQASSPAVDAANPDPAYNDPEDPDQAGQPLAPAQGSLRGDMGYTGGPHSRELPTLPLVSRLVVELPPSNAFSFGEVMLETSAEMLVPLQNSANGSASVDSVVAGAAWQQGSLSSGRPLPLVVEGLSQDTLRIVWSPQELGSLSEFLTLHWSDSQGPASGFVVLSGTAVEGQAAPDAGSKQPRSSWLSPVWPNPFNASTQIRFGLESAAQVRLTLHNLQGQLVRHLLDGPRPAGQHSLHLNGQELASGSYILRLSSDSGFRATRRLTLVK